MASYLDYTGLTTLTSKIKSLFETSSNKTKTIEASDTKYPTSNAVKTYVDNNVVEDTVTFNTSTITIQPNKIYVWNGTSGVTTLTVTKGTDVANKVNHYFIRFKAGSNCTITWSGFTLTWYDGNEPSFEAGTTYEISIIDNLAIFANF